MGYHSDDVSQLVPGTSIAVLSLGAERAITFRKTADKGVKEEHLLPSGSLLVMCAEMQAHWRHAILGTQEKHDGRISLTFRAVQP